MAKQRGKKAKGHEQIADREPREANRAVATRIRNQSDEVLGLYGSRAERREITKLRESQTTTAGQKSPNSPKHQLLQWVSHVSLRVQGKPLFRGVSQGWGVGSTSGLVIQPKLMVGAAGDRYEQEADRVAAAVVEQIHAPATADGGQAVQREHLEEDDDLRMKPMPMLQREAMEEEDKLHRMPLVQRVGAEGGEVSAEFESELNAARGGGQSLAPDLQAHMGEAMGADFSGVRVHTDGRADALNQRVGARAFTTKQDLFFKRGEYQPGSRGGQELIAHELTHVVQQNRGEVQLKRVFKQEEHEGGKFANYGRKTKRQQDRYTEDNRTRKRSVNLLTQVLQRADWDSGSLSKETTAFVARDKEQDSLDEFFTLKMQAEEKYGGSASDEFNEFNSMSRSEQASYLPEKDRKRYIRLANWFDLYRSTLPEINKYERKDEKKAIEEEKAPAAAALLERHHILPRATIRDFYDKLTPDQGAAIFNEFGHIGDTYDPSKVLQSLRSNLFIGPKSRCDRAHDSLDLLYTDDGEVELVSRLYLRVYYMMTGYDRRVSVFKTIMELLKLAESMRPEVRMEPRDWHWNVSLRNWEKRNKPK